MNTKTVTKKQAALNQLLVIIGILHEGEFESAITSRFVAISPSDQPMNDFVE